MDSKKHTTSPYPTEFRERAVQMVVDHLDSYASLTAAVRDIAAKLGCSPDSLRVWYKQAQRDAGKEAGTTSAGKARSEPLKAPLVQAQWRTNSSARTASFDRRTRS